MATTQKTTQSNRITNFMEEITDSVLQTLVLEYKPARFSQAALRDIKALALNRLWPMYTTSRSGKEHLKKAIADENVRGDVRRELVTAIAKVQAHPKKKK